MNAIFDEGISSIVYTVVDVFNMQSVLINEKMICVRANWYPHHRLNETINNLR